MKNSKHIDGQLYRVWYLYDNVPVNLFVAEEEYCKRYVERFNRILRYFKARNEKMEDEFGGIAFEFVDGFANSFFIIKESSEAYYEEIEFRK